MSTGIEINQTSYVDALRQADRNESWTIDSQAEVEAASKIVFRSNSPCAQIYFQWVTFRQRAIGTSTG